MNKKYWLLYCMAAIVNMAAAQVSDSTMQGFSPLKVGAAINVSKLKTNAQYRALVQREYNSITAENAMKFGVIHPAENTYSWADADTIVAFAQQTGKRIHGHTLLWHQNVPDWVTNFVGDSVAWENLMKNHILTVVGRYKDVITSWDVVNEVMGDNGTLRNTIWVQHLGPKYIERAFQYAHQADPNALLFYNDYNHESSSNSFAKLYAMLDLVDTLIAHNVPIHGIGMQMHVNKNINNANIGRAIDSVVNTGLKVHIAELDVAVNPEANQSLVYDDNVASQQFTKFKYIAKKARTVPAAQMYGITTWNVTDADSWIPGTYARPDFPLLFNGAYQKKYSYQGFKDGLTTNFPYTVSSGESLSGTYTDLGTNGTAITTGFTGNAMGQDNDNSAVQNIGFTFRFNGSDYSTFVLNTNGYIKLGNSAPYANNVFYSGIAGNTNSVISTSDIDLIYPYNHDLKASTVATTEHRVYTSGTVGSRVCTIQFKNVAEPYQYSNMNFQIKLYEGTNAIEFVYGTWTADPAKTNNNTTAAVGIKGALPEQSLNISKGSSIAWESALNPSAIYTFRMGDYAAAGPQFNTRNTVLPVSGKTYRFTTDVSLLPLKLLSFIAIDHKTFVALQWKTTNEKNTKTFNIERSVDGIHYSVIAVKNTTSVNPDEVNVYDYNDAGAEQFSGKIYYRLKQADIDGKFVYSGVIVINRKLATKLSQVVNPIKSELSMQLNAYTPGNAIIQLMDMNGIAVLKKDLFVSTGANLLQVPVPEALAAGTYVLKVYKGDEAFTQKIIKQ